MDFFKVTLKGQAVNDDEEYEEEKMLDEVNKRLSTPKPKAKKAKKILFNRKKATFKLPKQSLDPARVLKQKMSLAYGLLSKNIEFDDDLCFSNKDCLPSANDCSLEPNL